MNSSLRTVDASGNEPFCRLAAASLKETSLTLSEKVENALSRVGTSGCGVGGGKAGLGGAASASWRDMRKAAVGGAGVAAGAASASFLKSFPRTGRSPRTATSLGAAAAGLVGATRACWMDSCGTVAEKVSDLVRGSPTEEPATACSSRPKFVSA